METIQIIIWFVEISIPVEVSLCQINDSESQQKSLTISNHRLTLVKTILLHLLSD